MATLFSRLAANTMAIPDSLQGLVLLAALPAKWDSIAQLFMQRPNIAQQLTFANVQAAIVAEYERSGRPIDRTAHKLSAVKRKGPDPTYRQQHYQQQSQPGPSRQHQQPQSQQQAPKKRRGGRQEKVKQEKHARKQQHDHDYSHFASSAQIAEVVEPSRAPTLINTSQSSRAAPHHSSVASFGKNGIEYRKVHPAPPPKPTLYNSVWPSLNEARETCDQLAIPKTAKNLKPLEAPKVLAPIKLTADPFDSYKKAERAINTMMKDKLPATSNKGKGKARLEERITSAPFYPDQDLELFDNYEESGFDWAQEPMDYCEESQEPPVSLGDSGSVHDDPYHFDKSESDDEGASRQIGTLEMRMNVNRTGYHD